MGVLPGSNYFGELGQGILAKSIRIYRQNAGSPSLVFSLEGEPIPKFSLMRVLAYEFFLTDCLYLCLFNFEKHSF